MRIVVTIQVDETAIPEEIEDCPVEDWGTADLTLLLQDGDGGAHWVEAVYEVPDEAPNE